MLTRDQILSANDLRSEVVPVPDWDGEVTVRELTGEERDEYESSIVIGIGDGMSVNPVNMRAKLVAMSVVDENGERLFTMKDVKALGMKSGKALDRIVDAAQRLSGIDDAAMDNMGKGLAETLSAV